MASQIASHAEHPPHLAHHFDTPTQQFESGKLGMWVFLGTELLMFGGLFCAYAIYRANHPEIFEYAHRFLDVKLGAVNTVVLICSSFTMAYGVRAAQLGKRGLLIAMLALTLLCAGGFLGIKFVEYHHKFSHGLLWGTNYRSQEHGHGAEDAGHVSAGAADLATPATHAEAPAAAAGGSAAQSGVAAAEADANGTLLKRAAAPPPGLAPRTESDGHAVLAAPANPQIFFGIYFAMTGLHGFHVLAGMVVIGWLLVNAVRGVYGPEYFTPVDLVGLYWHIVDLIWIFLFPLLYLIH